MIILFFATSSGPEDTRSKELLRVRAWNTLTAASMLVVGELVYLLSCSVAGQVYRYGIPFLELVMCAALTQVAGILDVLLDRLGSSKLANK